MAKLAIEHTYGALSSYTYPGGYDSTKLGLGPLMYQYNGGGEGSFAGPMPISIGRPVETGAAFSGIYPFAINWSTTKQWLFLADNATAAATRRIILYELDKTTSTLTWKGYITVGFPFGGTQGTYTIQALRMTYDTYSTGTVTVSGTTVTGSGTSWDTTRFAGGARIGFGSTDPTQISTWYDISPTTTPTSTSITLAVTGPTIASPSSYVIEEIRAIIAVKNAGTPTNGGLFIVKGLNYSTFAAGGTAVTAATTSDNQRATYWVADASTSTNTNSSGLGLQDKADNSTHYAWVLQGTTTMQFYKFNLRAALTLTAGRDTVYNGSGAYQLQTLASATLTGTATQLNNGRLTQTSHGPGSGLQCIYFTTSTRVYRSIDVTTITNGISNHLADMMTEIPPGTANTFAATGSLTCLEYASIIDRFILMSSGATSGRSYITQYNTTGAQIDRIFLVDNKQIDQAAVDSSTTPNPAILVRAQSVWSESGICYLVGTGTSAATNIIYTIPIGADWEYASLSNSRIVTPEIPTPNCSSYSKFSFNQIEVLGGDTGHNLGLAPEPIRASYRTSGISDNTGSWTLLNDTKDLSSISPAASIQFMFEFRTIGLTCIPGRLLSSTLTYNDFSTDSHFQPSVTNSSAATKIFSWRFSAAFSQTNVPRLRIRLYNAIVSPPSNLILDDDTTSQAYGVFQQSSDGGQNWSTYSTVANPLPDKSNETTYIRYTPTSISDNIKVRALLTQY